MNQPDPDDSSPIPRDLHAPFGARLEPGALLERVVEAYGRAIGADRSLLFVYDRAGRHACLAFAWQRRPEWALPRPVGVWSPLADDLAATDPMFAQALVDPEAIYVDDIDAADPARVNAAYEREHFGHRALVHAPLLDADGLHGILEPCSIEAPRRWTDADRAVTAWLQARLAPVVTRYAARARR